MKVDVMGETIPRKEGREARSHNERVRIEAAITQLLTQPRADSVQWPNVSELARVAGVKRWVLTHKHTDLMERFQSEVQRLKATPAGADHPTSPAAPQRPSSLQLLREEIDRLRHENAELRESVAAHEHALLAVGMEYHALATQRDVNSNMRLLPPRPLLVSGRSSSGADNRADTNASDGTSAERPSQARADDMEGR